MPPLALGAGFRFSTYGPGYDPGPAYWLDVAEQMAAKFPGSRPQALWIVSNVAGPGTILTFPGSHEDVTTIHFSPEDRNEEVLTLFDEHGVDVWLQVEPSDADVEELIDIVLDRYGHHPSVIGVGVDVEWFRSDVVPQGEPITDADARAWVAAARAHDSGYRLFLKHWLPEYMPPTEREGIFFIDDSQGYEGGLEEMLATFGTWGKTFAPAQVGFQFGYHSDKPWWDAYADPPSEIGDAILAGIPNTAGLYWVDFTVIDVFPPESPAP